jgi:hypothetical protein
VGPENAPDEALVIEPVATGEVNAKINMPKPAGLYGF